MKQLTIHIPDNKFQYVMDLLTNLSFVKIDKPKKAKIIFTEQQIAEAEEEFRKAEEIPGYALDWEIVKHQLRVD